MDADKDTLNIDASRVEEFITKKTSAIWIPNMLGNIPDWDVIKEVANRHGTEIPHLCYSNKPGYRADGNCRACMVEIEGEKNLSASCIRFPSDGMKVNTTGERVECDACRRGSSTNGEAGQPLCTVCSALNTMPEGALSDVTECWEKMSCGAVGGLYYYQNKKGSPCTLNNKNLQLVHYDHLGSSCAAFSRVLCALFVFIAW